MNKLSIEKQVLILSLLTEGNSIRSTERITGVHRDTIIRLLLSCGEIASRILDTYMRNLRSRIVEVDEIWCFVGKKQKNATEKEQEKGLGDNYTFIAMDAETKIVISFISGKRNGENADWIMKQLSDRIPHTFQLTTDAFKAYHHAVYKNLGGDVHYGQVIKRYERNEDRWSEARYSPPKIKFIERIPIMGQPEEKYILTNYIERQNLTVRMENRRLTRLTNAFSKKVENLQAALAVHFFHYNFMRIHKTLRYTPAMAARVARSIWDWNAFLQWEEAAIRP